MYLTIISIVSSILSFNFWLLYLDGFNLSKNKYICISQILSPLLFILLIYLSYIESFSTLNNMFSIVGDSNNNPNINVGAHIEISKGISSVGKNVGLAGSIGGGAFMLKNIAGNISEDIGKENKFISEKMIEILNDSLSLSGNYGVDLLNVVNFMQRLQFIFIIAIIYIFIVKLIKEEYVEKQLNIFISAKYVKFIINYLRLIKRGGNLIIICLLILLLINNWYCSYYLEFFIQNLDKIVDLYFKIK